MNAIESLSPTEIELLKKSALLSPVSESVFQKLLVLGERVTYGEGDLLLQEGGQSDYLFVIISGSTQLFKENINPRKKKFTIASLQSGESFGEMRLVKNAPCSLTVVASSPLVVLRLPISQLHLKQNEEPYFALLESITTVLNSRLMGGNQDIMVVTGVKEKRTKQLLTSLIIGVTLAFFLIEVAAGLYYLTHTDDFCKLKQVMQGHYLQ